MSRTKELPSQPQQALVPSNQNLTNQTIFSKVSKKRSLPSFLNEDEVEGGSSPQEQALDPQSSSKEAELLQTVEVVKMQQPPKLFKPN